MNKANISSSSVSELTQTSYSGNFANDFFCKLCRAKMNDVVMYKKHMIGKRHMKNLNKSTSQDVSIKTKNQIAREQLRIAGGSRFLKTKNLEEVATIQSDFEEMTEPIVGLDFIREIWRRDDDLDPVYFCSLCEADCQRVFVSEHVIGFRHRLSYLKIKNERKHYFYENSHKKRSELALYLALDVRSLEEQYGKGVVKSAIEIRDDEGKIAVPINGENMAVPDYKTKEFKEENFTRKRPLNIDREEEKETKPKIKKFPICQEVIQID